MCDADFASWLTREDVPREDQPALPAGTDDTIDPQFFRVHNLFDRVTYKPGTRIVVEHDRNRVCVNIWIPTVDSNHPDETYDGRFYTWAPYWIVAEQSDEELLKWLMYSVAAFETHEVMESFMVGGKRMLEPHPWEGMPERGEHMHECAKIYDLQSKEETLEV